MRVKVTDDCLFPNVSDSVLIRTDLLDDATSSWARLLSSTPRESSVKSLRLLSRFGLSAVTSDMLTLDWLVKDDIGEDYMSETGDAGVGISYSIPDGIPPPRLQLADSKLLDDSAIIEEETNDSVNTHSIASSVSDTDTHESDESDFDFELPDDLPDDLPIGCPLLRDAFSSGFINFGLTLAVDEKIESHEKNGEEDDDCQYYSSADALSNASSAEEKFGGGMLFANISTPNVSEQKREDGDHLEEAKGMDTIPALIPAAVEGKQAAAVRSLSHYRTQRDTANAKESLRANAGTELLKRQRNADGTRRFDFSVFVDISQASVDHILGLLHSAHLM